MKSEKEILKELQTIPGIGTSLAHDLYELGITSVKDLIGKDAETLYHTHETLRGTHIDRCVLYTFRCAIYFAETKHPDPSLLKWWNWKDR